MRHLAGRNFLHGADTEGANCARKPFTVAALKLVRCLTRSAQVEINKALALLRK